MAWGSSRGGKVIVYLGVYLKDKARKIASTILKINNSSKSLLSRVMQTLGGLLGRKLRRACLRVNPQRMGVGGQDWVRGHWAEM